MKGIHSAFVRRLHEHVGGSTIFNWYRYGYVRRFIPVGTQHVTPSTNAWPFLADLDRSTAACTGTGTGTRVVQYRWVQHITPYVLLSIHHVHVHAALRSTTVVYTEL